MNRNLWITAVLAVLLTMLFCGFAMAAPPAEIKWSVSDDGTTLTIRGNGAMYNYSADDELLWDRYKDNIKSIIIESGLTSIGSYAFDGFSKVQSITLPDGLTYINEGAFRDCLSLNVINFPDGLITIEKEAFCNCVSLTDITFPNGFLIAGVGAFRNCSRLTYVTFPEKIMSLHAYCFENCSNLEFIALPEGLTQIDYGTFDNCSNLISISIPASVEKIETSFPGCSNLEGFYVDSGNDHYHSKDGILFSGGKIVRFPEGKMGDYKIPDNIYGIETYAFYQCTGLTSITFPDNWMSSTGMYSFFGCSNLASITFSNLNYLTEIGICAFDSCTSLTNVIIPDGVVSIMDWAFMNCTGLTDITIPESVTTIEEAAFKGCSSLADIHYAGNSDQWNAIQIGSDNEWLTEATIHFKEDPPSDPTSGLCGTDVRWKMNPDGTLIISGTGEIDDYGFIDSPPWIGYRESIIAVQIEQGVTAIGCYAFRDCSNLKSVSIPDSVTIIRNNAFYNCSSLINITIPAGVTSIEYSAFSWCISLTRIYIYNPDTTIGSLVFYNYPSSLTIYGWPGSTAEAYATDNSISFCTLTTYPDPAFFLPESLISISADAFIGIRAVAVVIPKSVISISDNPFVGSSVEYIFGYADSVAKTFADAYGYQFIAIDDTWMASYGR